VASKKVEKPTQDAQTTTEPPASTSSAGPSDLTGQDNEQATSHAKAEDWETEKSEDELKIQGLVDRLHDKAEKEVARVIKVRHSPTFANILGCRIRSETGKDMAELGD
jgi:ATP-dependent RNA helicase DHX29